jgi:serine/threonine protein kinase
LKAFYYLHKKFKKTSSHNSETVILHRDFKPQNIFLKRTKKDFYPEVKIGDFGLARELLRKLHASTKAGSYHTLAPEILEFWES